MNRPKWRVRAALATAAAAALVMTVAQMANAGVVPAPLPTASGAAHPTGMIPAPTLPNPSLPVPPPPVRVPPVKPSPPVKPPPAPSLVTPGPQAPPVAGAPAAVDPGSRAGDGAARASGSQVPVNPGTAGAIIAANPGADLYPQPPVDAATTPQARQVAALGDVEHRIQYLNNILARTRADLATLQRQPDPVPHLLTALTGAASAPATARLDSTNAVDTPTGRVFALSAAIASGETELTRRQDEAAALQREITHRVQTALAAAAPPVAVAAEYAGGRLLRPVSGPVTSTFGTRFDPYYHVWQRHAGVDLATPTGTPIVAAASGRVTQAGWFGGYGNYTCIDHGKVDGQRLSTCYGHQSKILVSPGQQVQAGKVIGRVGSTGASTGPHLHFEVRLGGRPVDPLPWI